jgi:hypothetical protein
LATHAEITKRPRRHAVEARSLERPHPLRAIQWLEVGCVAGVLGGIALALPLILWDWVHAGHRALELPMATTAWLFGLDHFSHSTYFIGSIVVGFVLLGVYWAVSGLVFTGLADRLLGIATIGKSLAAGAAWSFVSFIFFWNMLLPIARDGAPLRAASVAPGLFVAPDWVWTVAFTAFGLVTGAVYASMRSGLRQTAEDERIEIE